MSYHDEAWQAIKDANNDLTEAAAVIFAGPRKLALYVLLIGLQSIARKKRAARRSELRAEVKPEFKRSSSGVTGSVVLTERAKKRLFEHTQKLFGDDGWNIGNLNLGDMTREGLLVQADVERKSAVGSIRNADFYEALAEPLKPGQSVRDYWTPKKAGAVRDKIWKGTEGKRPTLA